MARINVNTKNSMLLNNRLYITALKAQMINSKLQEFVVTGNNVNHPTKGLFYEYIGNYSRKDNE
jgi:hypothetical protein|tara:strand:+ start:1720 stop:1911 length:192 start_codon:yes stop_codon:yes gene_type:complete